MKTLLHTETNTMNSHWKSLMLAHLRSICSPLYCTHPCAYAYKHFEDCSCKAPTSVDLIFIRVWTFFFTVLCCTPSDLGCFDYIFAHKVQIDFCDSKYVYIYESVDGLHLLEATYSLVKILFTPEVYNSLLLEVAQPLVTRTCRIVLG